MKEEHCRHLKKKTEKQYGIIILVNDPKRVKNELCSIKYD